MEKDDFKFITFDGTFESFKKILEFLDQEEILTQQIDNIEMFVIKIQTKLGLVTLKVDKGKHLLIENKILKVLVQKESYQLK